MNLNLLAQVDFDAIKPTAFPSGSFAAEAETLGEVISQIIPYIYIIAGLILFGLLIMGGFSFLTSGGDPKKVEAAQGKITHAVVGFLIIFLSYWLAQLLEILFDIQIF